MLPINSPSLPDPSPFDTEVVSSPSLGLSISTAELDISESSSIPVIVTSVRQGIIQARGFTGSEVKSMIESVKNSRIPELEILIHNLEKKGITKGLQELGLAEEHIESFRDSLANILIAFTQSQEATWRISKSESAWPCTLLLKKTDDHKLEVLVVADRTGFLGQGSFSKSKKACLITLQETSKKVEVVSIHPSSLRRFLKKANLTKSRPHQFVDETEKMLTYLRSVLPENNFLTDKVHFGAYTSKDNSERIEGNQTRYLGDLHTALHTGVKEEGVKASISPFEGLSALADVAGTLQLIHDRGLVHADVKPANILVKRNTEGKLEGFLNDFDYLTLFNFSEKKSKQYQYWDETAKNGFKLPFLDNYSLLVSAGELLVSSFSEMAKDAGQIDTNESALIISQLLVQKLEIFDRKNKSKFFPEVQEFYKYEDPESFVLDFVKDCNLESSAKIKLLSEMKAIKEVTTLYLNQLDASRRLLEYLNSHQDSLKALKIINDDPDVSMEHKIELFNAEWKEIQEAVPGLVSASQVQKLLLSLNN